MARFESRYFFYKYLLHLFIFSDPKISIDPMSWQGDALAVGFVGALVAAVVLVGAALICWYTKSKHR